MADKRIFEILREGLSRARKARYVFREPDGQRRLYEPFFTSIGLFDKTSYDLEVSNGGLMGLGQNPCRSFHGRIEVRMGDYARGGGVGSKTFTISKNIDRVSSLQEIWDGINESFWDCVEDYTSRNADAVGSQDKREKYAFFSREPQVVFTDSERKLDFDLGEILRNLRTASRKLMNRRIVKADIDFSAERINRYLASSERSRVFNSFARYQVILRLTALDSKNRFIPHTNVFYAADASHIPSLARLLEEGEKLDKELADIVKAPIQKNGAFPVIMDQRNHGVLWHEVVGHALEAHRMQEDDDDDSGDNGRVTLFLGRLGQKVAPRFISVSDDPTRDDLDGHYKFDEEGVKAQKVELIKRGILRNYLHSRASAGYFRKQSNGHARASNSNDPVSRMSNLLIDSSNTVPFEQLKENLVRECEKQHEKYGLMFIGVDSGLTLPEECHFETYPARVFRVYKTGKTEQVRGIYIVGTPSQVMKNVLQTSDQYDIFRGFCGAESGWVPSAIVAPHALISSLEVNRIPDEHYRQLKHIVVPRPSFRK